MTSRFLSIAVPIAVLTHGGSFTHAETTAKPSVKLTEQADRLRIEMNGEHFTDYIVRGEELLFPLFYPVLGPGQVAMTRKYPLEVIPGEDNDHPHHQSIWFAHSEINGHSFWAVKPYHGKSPGKTVHQKFTSIESGEREGGFVSEDAYVADDGTVILTDTRTVRFIAPEQPDGPRILDITIAFHASNGPVTLGDEKDAGMAIRVASELQVEKRTGGEKGKMLSGKGHLLNSEGIKDKDTWGKRARWLDAYGEVGGKPVGVAIMDHPSNPRHPSYWHSRTYGLLTANVFGKSFFEALPDKSAGQMVIPAGETVTFRWRFVFHRDDPSKANSEGLYKAFAAD